MTDYEITTNKHGFETINLLIPRVFIYNHSYFKNNLFLSKYFNIYNKNIQNNFLHHFAYFILSIFGFYLYWSDYMFLNIYFIDNLFYLCNSLKILFNFNSNIFNFNYIFAPKYIVYIFLSVILQFFYCISPLWYFKLIFIILLQPSIITVFVNSNLINNIYFKLWRVFENLFYFVLSKQIADILNFLSFESFHFNPRFHYREFQYNIRNVNQATIINFIGAFAIASILQYFEQNGTNIYTMLFRQYYFKSFSLKQPNNINFNQQLCLHLQYRNWDQILNSYNLNQLIRFYTNNKLNKSNKIICLINNNITHFYYVYLQFMSCWIIHSLNLFSGFCILANLFFICQCTKIHFLKFIVIMFFYFLSLYTQSDFLCLIICNFILFFLVNKLSFRIYYDIYQNFVL